MSENSFFRTVLGSGEKISESQKKYELAKKEVGQFQDKFGKKLDAKILDTVAIFRAMGLDTDSSCGGHTNEPNDKRYGFPYVRFYVPAPKGWEEDKANTELCELWRSENLKQRARIEPLLEEFNKERNQMSDARLYLDDIGAFGAFTVESEGVKTANQIKTYDEAVTKIRSYQQEMLLFTNYLKQLFLRDKVARKFS